MSLYFTGWHLQTGKEDFNLQQIKFSTAILKCYFEEFLSENSKEATECFNELEDFEEFKKDDDFPFKSF